MLVHVEMDGGSRCPSTEWQTLVINFMLHGIPLEYIYILNKGKVFTPFIHEA